MRIRNENRTEARQRDIERYILNNFDLAGLKEAGFINSSRRSRKNFLAVEERIITYFGIDNIYRYDDLKVTKKNLEKWNYLKADTKTFSIN